MLVEFIQFSWKCHYLMLALASQSSVSLVYVQKKTLNQIEVFLIKLYLLKPILLASDR